MTNEAARLPELSYFFPAHNEEANLEGLVQEALAALPSLARWWSAMLRTPAKSRPAARARVVVEIGVLA